MCFHKSSRQGLGRAHGVPSNFAPWPGRRGRCKYHTPNLENIGAPPGGERPRMSVQWLAHGISGLCHATSMTADVEKLKTQDEVHWDLNFKQFIRHSLTTFRLLLFPIKIQQRNDFISLPNCLDSSVLPSWLEPGLALGFALAFVPAPTAVDKSATAESKDSPTAFRAALPTTSALAEVRVPPLVDWPP